MEPSQPGAVCGAWTLVSTPNCVPLRPGSPPQASCKNGSVKYYDIRNAAKPLWKIDQSSEYPVSSVSFRCPVAAVLFFCAWPCIVFAMSCTVWACLELLWLRVACLV